MGALKNYFKFEYTRHFGLKRANTTSDLFMSIFNIELQSKIRNTLTKTE